MNKVLQKYNLDFFQGIRRAFFYSFWALFCSWTPPAFHKYRVFILNSFGAKLAFDCYLYSSVKIWDPKNLIMGEKSCLGPRVTVYNIAKINVEKFATVSQDTTLCTASHDYEDRDFHLVAGEISIQENAWVAAEAFIGPGVIVEQNSVVAARSVIVNSVKKNTLVAGNPAREIKEIRRK